MKGLKELVINYGEGAKTTPKLVLPPPLFVGVKLYVPPPPPP